MTQMMLFDHQSLATPTLTPPATRPSVKPSSEETDDGIHRMGDLARLVVLRYQLVAKRREAMASR